MAIDSANKRRSVLALDGPMLGIGPVPDGNLAMMADVRHLVGGYRFDDLAALTNTHNKRRSVFGLDGPMFVTPPVPDGSLENGPDRRHVAGHYRQQNDAMPSGWSLPDRELAWTLAVRSFSWSLPER
jgi:hypothetical protein